MSGIDKSSLATHIKCGSDLSKVYPGITITEEMIKEAETLYDSYEFNKSQTTFIETLINKFRRGAKS